jgi:hypothetical protein
MDEQRRDLRLFFRLNMRSAQLDSKEGDDAKTNLLAEDGPVWNKALFIGGFL